MNNIKEGGKGRVVCQNCGLTTTTYALRDVPFDDQSGTVKNILAGICDQCGEVVAIPPQSAPKIKEKLEGLK